MRLLPLLALVVLTVRCAHAPEAAPTASAPPSVSWPEALPPALRLPDTVRPVHYALDLKLVP
ncbi:hypothetical protein [Corallococcus sp. AB030]